MKTFSSLNSDFRKAFKHASKNGAVKFTVEGIKDDPNSIYPLFEVSGKHVMYYLADGINNKWVCITDQPIKAIIYP